MSSWPGTSWARRRGRSRGESPRAAVLVVAVLSVLVSACSGATTRASGPVRPPGHRPTTTTTGAGPTTTAPDASGAAWTTYGGSFTRTSAGDATPALTHAPARAWTSPALDGAVYGEPLIDQGQVLVATENDTVYSLSATDGTVAWSLHLASPVPAGMLPCGDITPVVGVTSTMVIDQATGVLYVSAEQLSSGRVAHVLYAIDLANHQRLWSMTLDQPGWQTPAQLQRTGLALSANHVLVAFGGNFGDCGSYHGAVIGVPESGTGPLLTYQVPTANEGAIWAPAGITVDAAGNVYVATGNGSAHPGQAFDRGNAVIELSSGLSEMQYFAPTNWADDNAEDLDLGSTSPILLGNGQLFVVGKEATAYLLDASSLGGIGGQAASRPVCNSRGGNAYLAPYVYVVCADTGQLAQVKVGPGNALGSGWRWSSPSGGAGSPTIAYGVVWTIGADAQVLYGVDPATGSTRYRVPLDVGTPEHFAAPSAAGGLIVVAGSQAVEAFR
ncbi:MAG: PQQ-binding-like beta-propeller repeat protein [Acidimicrobiales bacterium]|nr:PQQ-binding-like beta-propeller repeat protein [Acidimicrobiales bacterium]